MASKLDELMALVDEHALRFYGAVKYGGTAEDQRAALQSSIKALVEDAERWNWLASDMDGNAQGDFIQTLNESIIYPKSEMDRAIDAARKP